MWEKNHLPAVGAGATSKVALTKLSYGILEELEKAHIYIERLNEQLKEKDDRLARIEAQLGLK